MKIILLLLSLAISTLAVVPERQVLITYPDDTPPAELHRAKSAIEEAVRSQDLGHVKVNLLTIFQGGRILHDFGESKCTIAMSCGTD